MIKLLIVDNNHPSFLEYSTVYASNKILRKKIVNGCVPALAESSNSFPWTNIQIDRK